MAARVSRAQTRDPEQWSEWVPDQPRTASRKSATRCTASGTRCLLPLHHTNELLEAGELRLDHVDRDLILELERRGIELLRRKTHDHLGAAEPHDVDRGERLAQMILRARAAEQATGGRLHRGRLAGERLVLEARGPVDRVLEPARDRPV